MKRVYWEGESTLRDLFLLFCLLFVCGVIFSSSELMYNGVIVRRGGEIDEKKNKEQEKNCCRSNHHGGHESLAAATQSHSNCNNEQSCATTPNTTHIDSHSPEDHQSPKHDHEPQSSTGSNPETIQLS